MKLMTAKLMLTDSELVTIREALLAVIRPLEMQGDREMTLPYLDIEKKLYAPETKLIGLHLIGGQINCIRFALEKLPDSDEKTKLLTKLTKRTQGYTDPSVPHDGT